ncbi:HNH endonuclease [Escherichia phage BUCT-XGG-1]
MIFNNILNYKNGLLFWAIKPSAKVYEGDLAGTIDSEGYIKVMYKKKS